MKSSVIGIVFDSKKNHVLILHRRDVPVWVLPGGGIDLDETPEEAILREVEEETGIKVAIVRKVGEYTPINKLSLFTHVFECVPVGGSLKTGPETSVVGFYPIAELPDDFFIIHLEWLADAMRNDAEVIHKPIASVTYLNLIKYFLRHPTHVLRILISRIGLPLNNK